MDPPNGGAAPRKVRFKPRAPPRRVPKVEVKSEVDEDIDAIQAKDLLRRFNEGAMKARKVEKKVKSSQIAFGCGGEQTSLKSYRLSKCGSSANGNQNLGVNGATEKEYKEPWDYHHSIYPTTLPLRKPYSGNPAILDEVEFGEAAESIVYDENLANSARELGLLEENPEPSFFLVHLPPHLPMINQSVTADGKNVNENNKRAKNVQKATKLNDLPAGLMGKMLVYKSGKIKLKLGNTLYDVSSGMNISFAEDVVAINTDEKSYCTIGNVSKHATITPDVVVCVRSREGVTYLDFVQRFFSCLLLLRSGNSLKLDHHKMGKVFVYRGYETSQW